MRNVELHIKPLRGDETRRSTCVNLSASFRAYKKESGVGWTCQLVATS
jgi:hypothetical protein